MTVVTQTQRTNEWILIGREESEMNWETGIDIHIHYIYIYIYIDR